MRRQATIAQLLFAFVFVASSVFSSVFAEGPEGDLTGDWLISTQDSNEFASVDLEDTDSNVWKREKLPANLYKQQHNGVIWLRKHFHLVKPETNLAVILGAVYDRDRVYLNGELIGEKMSESYGYGRPRVYSLPAGLLVSGENLLAVRIEGSFRDFIGITSGPIAIDSIQKAESTIWNHALRSLIFSGIYFSTGLFFVVLFLRVGNMRDYIFYSIFTMAFALQQLMRNELRFQIADAFFAFKVAEQMLYIVATTSFFFFFVHFFSLKLHRLVYLYPIFSVIVALLLPIVHNPVRMDTMMSIWFPFNIPFFLWYLYVTVRKAMEGSIDGFVLLVGILLMLPFTIHYFGRERGLWGGPDWFDAGVLIFIFCVSFALIFRLIRLHLDVEKRRMRLDSVNLLRDRVFRYIDSILRTPAQAILAIMPEITSDEKSDRDKKELIEKTDRDLTGLQLEMDDILELSRLEVITEPESFENVNFKDFITAVIPQGAITSYINVDPNIEIKTSLELVNSMVIRLIDFPGFKEFRHIDLIITSDLSGNIHFRFLLFHNDFRQTRKLHDLITSLNPEKGSLWAKWAIVREIIRILDGSMNISILSRKFLRIDITLKAEKLAPRLSTSPVDYIKILPLGELVPAIAGGPGEEAPGPSVPLPALSANMSLGDFVKYARARLTRKR